LRLAEELRSIKESILRSKNRNTFDIEQEGAIRPKDLRRLILEESPHIIHFSGHGESGGIFLENEEGFKQPVNNEALSELISLFDSVCCIILNSCYSVHQANYLKSVSPYIIGMAAPIEDRLAIKFSEGFYDALAAGRSIEDSFKFGLNSIDLNNLDFTNSNRSIVMGNNSSKTKIPILIKGSISCMLPEALDPSLINNTKTILLKLIHLINSLIKDEKYIKSRRIFLTSGITLGIFCFFDLARNKKLNKFIPLSIKNPTLVKNRLTGAIHDEKNCKDHLPIKKNIEDISFNVSYKKLHSLGGNKVIKSILSNLSDNEKELFLLEAISNNPTSTHLYKWLIRLYGKIKNYGEIDILLNNGISYLMFKNKIETSKKLKKQYEKGINDLKVRQLRASVLAQLSRRSNVTL
jgi:hypothetical protein